MAPELNLLRPYANTIRALGALFRPDFPRPETQNPELTQNPKP